MSFSALNHFYWVYDIASIAVCKADLAVCKVWKLHRVSIENLEQYFYIIIINEFLVDKNVVTYNKQIFHAFLFNIRNYSSEIINIQRLEVELNIILPKVNNYDIKQEKAWNICFIICHQHQTTSGKIKTNKTQILFKTQVFFAKTELRHIWLQHLVNLLYCFCWCFFLKSLTHEKTNRIRIFLIWNWQLIRDWCEIKQENMIHIYDVAIIEVTGMQ